MPSTARIEPALVPRWSRRFIPVALASAALIAAQCTLGTLRPSPTLELAGLLATITVVAVAVTLARTSATPPVRRGR